MYWLNGVRCLASTDLKNLLLMANLPTHLNMKREHMQFGMMNTEIGVLDLLPCVAKKSGIPAFLLAVKFTLVVTIFVLQIQIMSGTMWIEMVIGSQQITTLRSFLPMVFFFYNFFVRQNVLPDKKQTCINIFKKRFQFYFSIYFSYFFQFFFIFFHFFFIFFCTYLSCCVPRDGTLQAVNILYHPVPWQ